MTRYIVEYTETVRRRAVVEAENEGAARRAVIDYDTDEDVEVDGGFGEILHVKVSES